MPGAREDVQKVAELAKDIRIAMLTTVDEHGHFVSRPMAQQEVEFDGNLWFFSSKSARKVSHLSANPAVSVTLSSRDVWISLSGTAEVVSDAAKAEELWNPMIGGGSRRDLMTTAWCWSSSPATPPSTGTIPEARSPR